MKVRVWIWTIGLAFVGYSLGGRSSLPHPTGDLLGTALGAIVGFGIGWGLQRLLEMGRKR